MSSVKYVIPKKRKPSPTLAMAALFEYLLGSDPEEIDGFFYASYYPPGNSSGVLYDVADEFPQTPGDFSAGQGRIVITSESTNYDNLGTLMRSQMTLFAYANARNDSAYLAEHAHYLLGCWTRSQSVGQCIQSLTAFKLGKTTYEKESNLFYTALMFQLIAG